jgi:hypothetical protein
MNRCTYTNEVWYSKRSLTHLQVLFDEAFRYGDGAKFWDYFGTNAETLCIDFCNFVHL